MEHMIQTGTRHGKLFVGLKLAQPIKVNIYIKKIHSFIQCTNSGKSKSKSRVTQYKWYMAPRPAAGTLA